MPETARTIALFNPLVGFGSQEAESADESGSLSSAGQRVEGEWFTWRELDQCSDRS